MTRIYNLVHYQDHEALQATLHSLSPDEAKKQINQANELGYLPLHEALLQRNHDTITLLLHHGADVNQLGNHPRQHTLALARRTQDPEIIDLILLAKQHAVPALRQQLQTGVENIKHAFEQGNTEFVHDQLYDVHEVMQYIDINYHDPALNNLFQHTLSEAATQIAPIIRAVSWVPDPSDDFDASSTFNLGV